MGTRRRPIQHVHRSGHFAPCPFYTPGAREMYCRNVYLRTGLRMPTDGWAVDLGANRGLFSVWAAATGARVVAVEAQIGFATEIRQLAAHNCVAERVSVEIAIAGGETVPGDAVGVVADDHRWSTTSHGGLRRPACCSMPELMRRYGIGQIGLLKLDIEGGEFAVLGRQEGLQWLDRVDQIALEVHPAFGDPASLVDRLKSRGFIIDLRDNDGARVAATSSNVNYAYCSR